MASNQQILREYLLSLGFKVDLEQRKKFVDGLEQVEKTASNVGKALVGLGATVVGAVMLYGRGLEKLFYSAQRTGATTNQLKAVSYAYEQIGLSADQAGSTLTRIADQMIQNKGYADLMRSFGIDATLKGGALILDIVKKLQTQAPEVRYQLGEMFGIGMGEFRQIENNLGVFEKAMAQREKEVAQIKDDAEAWRDFNNATREAQAAVIDLVGIGARLAVPFLRDFGSAIREAAKDWRGIAADIEKPGGWTDFWTRLAEGTGLKKTGGGVVLSEESKKRLAAMGSGTAGTTAPRPLAAQAAGDKAARLRSLEKQYALPAGLLDTVWMLESGRGKTTYNTSTGAAGDFQFVPKTAKEYGIEGKEYDFNAASDAAARKFQNLLRWSHGDVATALAGYNRGEGNFTRLDKGSLGNAPAETRDYVARGMANMNQSNTFIINGGNAKEVADAVGDKLAQQNRSWVRDMGVVAR